MSVITRLATVWQLRLQLAPHELGHGPRSSRVWLGERVWKGGCGGDSPTLPGNGVRKPPRVPSV